MPGLGLVVNSHLHLVYGGADDYLSVNFELHREVAMKLSGCLDNFPVGWTDPLDLYGGHIQELLASGCNLETERHTLSELIKVYDATWVWCNRRRLAQVAKGLKNYPIKQEEGTSHP